MQLLEKLHFYNITKHTAPITVAILFYDRNMLLSRFLL